jgi:hypothetical protein
MSQIEFVVTRRCIPYFKKEVDGLPVGLVPYDVWSALCNQLTRINRPNNISAQKKFLPNTGWRVPLGFSQLEYQLERMRFDAGNIPPLLHSHWFMIKYLSASSDATLLMIRSFTATMMSHGIISNWLFINLAIFFFPLVLLFVVDV